MESGQSLNYAKIARETGLGQPTVKSHYQLLEEMFVGFRVPAFTGSSVVEALIADEGYFCSAF